MQGLPPNGGGCFGWMEVAAGPVEKQHVEANLTPGGRWRSSWKLSQDVPQIQFYFSKDTKDTEERMRL